MLETLDYTIRIGSAPTFVYFDLNTLTLFLIQNTKSRNTLRNIMPTVPWFHVD